VHCVE